MLWWLTSVALAGSVFVNGVNVDSLRDTTFSNVTVKIDSQGNLLIDAPGYTIEVVDAAGAPVGPAPAPSPAPAPAPVSRVDPPAPAPAPAPVPASALAAGSWWLITEDNGSVGHTVDVFVNGVKVTMLRSGAEPYILDVGPWLRRGPNTVEVRSNSIDAGGGAMYVYIGEGRNDTGTIVMNSPSVQFGLGPSRQGPHSRTYQLVVP